MAVTITPTDPEDARRLAIRLLRAAGIERHDEVRTRWDERVGVLFVVPDDLAWGLLGPSATGAVDPGEDESGPAGATVEPGAPVVEESVEPSVEAGGEPAGSDSPPVDGPGSQVAEAQALESERAPKRASRAGARKRAARPRVEFSER